MLEFFKDRDNTKENRQEMHIEKLEAKLKKYEQALNSIEEVSIKACRGNMEARIPNWDKYGDISHVMGNLNQLLDLTDAFIREAAASLTAAQERKFHRQFLPQGMRGNFGLGADTINKTIKDMSAMEQRQKQQRFDLTNKFEEVIFSLTNELESATIQFNHTAEKLLESGKNNQKTAERPTQNLENASTTPEELASSLQKITDLTNKLNSQSLLFIDEVRKM